MSTKATKDKTNNKTVTDYSSFIHALAYKILTYADK